MILYGPLREKLWRCQIAGSQPIDIAGDLQASDPERIGPFRVLRRLGTGGMGQVYLARSPGGRAVAIKVIRPELAAKRGFRARFGREVAAAREVSGFFTAAVVGADPDAALPWMATAYVDGPSLADQVEERGPLSVREVVSLAAGLAEGLQAIHRTGLVHRDLKPSNVLLAGDGPRIIDFGISWVREVDRLTDDGIVVGSPGFLSPEQALGREVGPASDVFCLGAVLSYAATGWGPFGDGPTQALLYRVVHESPDLTLVPAALRRLIGGCLAKEPTHRPTTAQLLEQIAEIYGPPGGDADMEAGRTGAPAAEIALTQMPATGDRLAEGGRLEPGTRRLDATSGRSAYAGGSASYGESGAYGDDSAYGEGTAYEEGAPYGEGAVAGKGRRAGRALDDTVLDPPHRGSWSDDEPRGRRWWPIVAGVGCMAVVAGVTLFLTSSSGQPSAPAAPVTSVSPMTSGPNASLTPGGTGTGPSASVSPGGNPASAHPSATHRSGTASAKPSASAPAAPSSAPGQSTAPATPSTTPSAKTSTSTSPSPTASPTHGCFLICL
jgi:eukaryotic-like serine/threonine-protein kinase